LQRLHEYWMRGKFQVNREFNDKLVPYFVDEKGIPCAVGYLLLTSNGEVLVRDITLKNNFAYIRDTSDASLWAGTDQGLMHFSIQADSTLKRLGAFSPSATSFVINRLSARGKTIWTASAAGVSAFSKASQNWTQWDTTKLGVSRVLDVQGSNGDTLWLGVDGSTRLGSDPIVAFSTKGIWRMHNGVISRYQRNNSALPSDTVYGALAMDNNRIWIVSAGAVYQFTPPNTLKKMADFSNRPGPIARMVVNKRGQLWVGTRGGVFQLQNNAMVAIGNPAVSIGKTITKRDRFNKQTYHAALMTRSLLGRIP
jgi:ligand-binding sensor domain-containing protein